MEKLEGRRAADTGRAPLASMLGSGQLSFELERLKVLFGTEEHRASIVHVLRAAEAMGYDTVIATLDWEGLRKERRPAITRMLDRDRWGDYALLLGIVGDEAILVNAGLNLTRMTREDFCRTWSGWVVILHRRIAPARASAD